MSFYWDVPVIIVLGNGKSRLNFDLDNIIYNSSKQYNSYFSGEINSKLYNVNNLIVQNDNIDKNIFNPLHKNINKLLNNYKNRINAIFHFGEFSRIFQSFEKFDQCYDSNSNGSKS